MRTMVTVASMMETDPNKPESTSQAHRTPSAKCSDENPSAGQWHSSDHVVAKLRWVGQYYKHTIRRLVPYTAFSDFIL